jgi:DNA-binding transcriptional LysR family regulator
MFDWNDLRALLAVARHGSTLAAARHLRTSQTTVARRVAALEAALDLELFERRQDGYRLTEAGREILAAAERVEAAATAVAELAAARRRGAAGTVRLTTIDIAASHFVLPLLPDFQAAWPAVRVELLTAEEKLDIARGEADLGLRFGPAPEEPALVVRRVGTVRSALYCSRAYAERHGLPANAAALNNHALVRGAGWIDTRPQNLWLAEMAPRARIAYRGNTTLSVLEAIRRGLGIGSLPVATVTDDELVQVFPPPEEFAAPAWLVTSEAARRRPEIRACLDFLAPRLTRLLA